ncbi:hypothetical protein [Methylocystis echinoides]|uniref:hypothetical protein n=1 Tax=Methylocystis echinoides TaxID=29468 RepID=UPI003448BAAF
MIDHLDRATVVQAREFAKARGWLICRKPFSWRTLARGERIDARDGEPELPPFCSRPVFFRSRDGFGAAILALNVPEVDSQGCQQFAAAHGLMIETLAEWDEAILWTRDWQARERELIAEYEAIRGVSKEQARLRARCAMEWEGWRPPKTAAYILRR